MYKKIIKTLTMVCVIAMLIDVSYAFKLPGGLGGKKGKKNAAKAIAYSLAVPEYDPALLAYGAIGSYDLTIAGAPVCLKVMEVEISLAMSNKFSSKAKGYFTDALANDEQREQLKALREAIECEGCKFEENQSNIDERNEIENNIINNIDENKQLSKEQIKHVSKAFLTGAANVAFLVKAVKDTAEIPKLVKEGIDEVKGAIKDAKNDGIKGLKAVAGLTANLKAIQAAVKLPGKIVDSLENQRTLAKKLGALLKNNKVKVPSMEEAATMDANTELEDDDEGEE